MVLESYFWSYVEFDMFLWVDGSEFVVRVFCYLYWGNDVMLDFIGDVDLGSMFDVFVVLDEEIVVKEWEVECLK